MLNIRQDVFETNSSSAHSLTFSTDVGEVQPHNRNLNFVGDEFGWRWITYYDAQHKFSYWLVAFADSLNIKFHKALRNVTTTDTYGVFRNYVDIGIEKIKAVVNHFEAAGATFTFFDNQEIAIPFEEFIYNLESKNTEEYWNKFNSFSLVFDFGGYIDHQSGPGEIEDCEMLAEFDTEQIFNWVYGNGNIQTGNDYS